ncbi:MAG: hypothetical protein QGD88_11630 [Anaerolineae bacterium]|nr:hypothetical protein [Anaerolineae bacterium]
MIRPTIRTKAGWAAKNSNVWSVGGVGNLCQVEAQARGHAVEKRDSGGGNQPTQSADAPKRR